MGNSRHGDFSYSLIISKPPMGPMGPMGPILPPNDLPMRNDALWTLGTTIGLDMFVKVDMAHVGKINVGANKFGGIVNHSTFGA